MGNIRNHLFSKFFKVSFTKGFLKFGKGRGIWIWGKKPPWHTNTQSPFELLFLSSWVYYRDFWIILVLLYIPFHNYCHWLWEGSNNYHCSWVFDCWRHSWFLRPERQAQVLAERSGVVTLFHEYLGSPYCCNVWFWTRVAWLLLL